MTTGAVTIVRASQEASSGLSGRQLALAALAAWLLTAGIGAYMLRTWVTRGGLRAQRATGVGVPPAVVFGHAGVALTGLGPPLPARAFLASGATARTLAPLRSPMK